jgi:uncharacterized membrane protein YoaK (UPF0700 family)
MDGMSSELAAEARVSVYAPEQSLLVASLLSMSAGFLDVFTWLSLGGVFAASQTGNVVFLGMDALSGQWRETARHMLPIAAFIAGASVATRLRAPLLCLAGEIVCLTGVMLLLNRIPESVAITGIAFGIALKSASFRHVEGSQYLSVTVTANMLRGIDQFVMIPGPDGARSARAMATICLTFLVGAAIGGLTTMRLGTGSLVLPIAASGWVLWFCLRHRDRIDRN